MASIRTKRSVLFLQGLSSPFFVRLGRAMARRGHDVRRINFCGGDRLFWPRMGAVNFRGRFSGWRSFLGSYLHECGITDIVMFGDCRPYHRVAVDIARSRGIAVHVFEEGYFRPDWITLERHGTNGHSILPRNVDAVIAETVEDLTVDTSPQPVGGGFSRRVRWEFLSQFCTLLMSPLYPHYRRHRSRHPLRELLGWAMRVVIKRPFERRYMRNVSRYLTESDRKFYLLPLQLETDYQIRRHSSFRSMSDVMALVMRSFANAAPADAQLVVKIHPLDNGLVNFRRRANRIARRLNLNGRVFVIDGGHLPTLLSRSQGVVVVNSTTGLSAMHHNAPLKVLGRAVFDMPGLTFQGSLDRFWTEGEPADQELFRAFRRVVLRLAQVNGSFFTRAGMALAIEGALERIGVASLSGQAAARSRAEMEDAGASAVKSAVLLRQ